MQECRRVLHRVEWHDALDLSGTTSFASDIKSIACSFSIANGTTACPAASFAFALHALLGLDAGFKSFDQIFTRRLLFLMNFF